MKSSKQKSAPLGEVVAVRRSNRRGSPCDRGRLALGLLVLPFLGACGDSSDGTKALTDGSLDGRDARVDLVSGGADVSFSDSLDAANRDTAPLADAGPTDVTLDRGAILADVPALDSGRDGPGPLLDVGTDTPSPLVDSGNDDIARNDAPPTLDGAATGGAEAGASDGVATEAGGVQPAFACASLGPLASDVSQRLCYDFSSAGDSSSFTSEAGAWSVEDGTYHGAGPQDGQVTCPGGANAGSGMTTSVLATLSAADVRVHARMTTWSSPDKVLVLRSLASGSRIEVNFRSYWGDQQAGDLVIQSLVGCKTSSYLAPDTIRVPQYPYQAVEVVVQLRGQRMTIAMDGKQLYDDSPIATDGDGGTCGLPAQAGSVGFGVFKEGEAVFDNLVVEVLK
jgi:hypothetical protein